MKQDLFRFEPYWNKWIFSYNKEIYLLDKEPDGDTAHKVRYRDYPENGLSAPYRVQIQVTNRCNFACPHCYVSSGQPLPSEMSLEELYGLLPRLKEWGVLQVTWSGGEVFARKGFLDLVRYSDSLGFENAVLTNGYAFGKIKSINFDEMWELFTTIQISVDGWDSKFNEFVGLKNAWPVVKQAINTLCDTKPDEKKLKIATTISEDTASYEQIAKFIHQRDIVWRIAKQVYNGRSQVLEEEAEQLTALSYIALQDVRESYKIQSIHPYDKTSPESDLMPTEWHVEPGARWYLYIKANGDVYPFPYLDGITEHYAGNVLKDSFVSIWLSRSFDACREVTKENTGCEGCPYVCQMWTRSFNLGGGLYATPPLHLGCYKN